MRAPVASMVDLGDAVESDAEAAASPEEDPVNAG